MRFLLTLFLLLFLSLPTFAKEIVQAPSGAIEGKIRACIDGVVIIKKNGVEYSVPRVKNSDYFGDYIQYAVKGFSRKYAETNCRVVLVDLFSVTFETLDSRLVVPRYRVKNIFINAI